MRDRHSFLLRCLRSIYFYTNMSLRGLGVVLDQTREICHYDQAESEQKKLKNYEQDLKTLQAYKGLLENALDSLNESPALLPALAPIFQLVYGWIPLLNRRALEDIQRKWIQELATDNFSAPAFKKASTDLLLMKYEKQRPPVFTAVFLKTEKLNLQESLWASEYLFCTLILRKNKVLRSMLVQDASLLARQMGKAFSYSQHRYGEMNYPLSRTQKMAAWISGFPESIRCLRLALVLPWPEPQIGQTCKIHAFYAAAWVLHLVNPSRTPCPPPIHALPQMPADKLALVDQAKKLFGSQIGEVYSPAYILRLAKENGYDNVDMYKCKDDNYLSCLKRVIDAGRLALVYFDANLDPDDEDDYGYPVNRNADYEHSAVVAAYLTTEAGVDYFFVYQWENYYCFLGEDLLQSTGQLRRRRGEVFYDISINDKPFWAEEVRLRGFYPEGKNLIAKGAYKARLFSPPPPWDVPTFKNCIIAIGMNLECKEDQIPSSGCRV